MPQSKVMSSSRTPARANSSKIGGTSRSSGLERVLSVKTMQSVSPALASSLNGSEPMGCASLSAVADETSSSGGTGLEVARAPRMVSGKVKVSEVLP